jgi:hypothetical protein
VSWSLRRKVITGNRTIPERTRFRSRIRRASIETSLVSLNIRPLERHIIILMQRLFFTLVAGKECAMMYQANVSRSIRCKLFGEVCKTATKPDWLIMNDVDGVIKTRIEHYSSKLPPG